MTGRQRQFAALFAVTFLIAAAATWWQQREALHFLDGDTAAFVAQFSAPPAPDSAATRAELDELLALQAARTAQQVAAARADRKTRIERFYAALGLDERTAPPMPHLQRLAQSVEDDVRIYVRAAKEKFRRLRPYEIEPRLEPCIDDVRGDLSYPSGHAAYAHSMALLLARLVPERQASLDSRATEFARQRMVCGVHFPSDLAAGKLAAGRLLEAMDPIPEFREAEDAAAEELRAALGLAAEPARQPAAVQ